MIHVGCVAAPGNFQKMLDYQAHATVLGL